MARRIVDVVTLDGERWRKMSEASYRLAQDFNWPRSAEILERALLGIVDAPAASPAAAVTA